MSEVEIQHTRTIIEFHEGAEILRTVTLTETLPNVAVGQTIVFDHPSLRMGLTAKVTKISHTVFLGADPPLTYIDVDVVGAGKTRHE